MPTLPNELRNKLERVVIDARDAAEIGARAALEALAVHHHAAYPHMKPAQIELRNHLRARAQQLGDRKLPKPDARGKDLNIDHLTDECAYEHWHRMLFARFLAENSLLIEPQEKMAISLSEAEELAKEDGVNVWVFASRCAEGMLPQIFRPDDPLLQVSFATEHMLKLEKLLASLPEAVFTASDALGWVYQFWQSKKKDEVNRSEVKIGADEIAAVTQLFTEPYMVEFLLHNTLGAWWAGKTLTVKDTTDAKTEDELRRKLALSGVGWEYLRFTRGADGKSGPWRPAAGKFEGWPKNAAELKVLDPCCGSGHFLVAALHHLTSIRMTEESLSAREAIDAVLRDNLHGLEIDERCCQIAAFAVALTAWTYPGAGGYRLLPELQIAYAGIGPNSSKEQWLRLGEEIAAKGGMPAKRDLFGAEDSLLSSPIKQTLEALHELFSQAPILGSLINPAKLRADLFHADYKSVAPLLSAVLEAQGTDDEIRERAVAAAGMVKAADLLAGKYTLVVTNVPYLGRGRQQQVLKDYSERVYAKAKADLATCFVERCIEFCATNSAAALVTPISWLFQPNYADLRKARLANTTFQFSVRLGSRAFETITGEVVKAALVIVVREIPTSKQMITTIDATTRPGPTAKAEMLLTGELGVLNQLSQLDNPDAVIGQDLTGRATLLATKCRSFQGLCTSDDPQFIYDFWELGAVSSKWRWLQSSALRPGTVGGSSSVLFWEDGSGRYYKHAQLLKAEGRLGGWKSGGEAWEKRGVAVNVTKNLHTNFYFGDFFDNTIAALIPVDSSDLGAIYCFISSDEYRDSLRELDPSLSVTEHTLLKVPFDLPFWRKVAKEKFPHHLPQPFSSDPTQWIFNGHPRDSDQPLQVALARMIGYQWPRQTGSSFPDCLPLGSDGLEDLVDEGIICIPSVRGKEPAVIRLEAMLTAAGIKPAKVRELAGGSDLEEWLRNTFFEEHCKLFHDRPFVWHIWDGRKRDGFQALVNYHKLCEGNGKGRKLLESLTYAYLGDWITRQKDGVKRGEGGADDRLAAAVELQNRLKLILEGEPPFDLFVRWKPLAEQPIGWEPDMNDGVRMNIRPFLASDLPVGRAGAGVLRMRPGSGLHWRKDRGKEPKRPMEEYPWFWNWNGTTVDFMGTGKAPDCNRWNDCHYTIKAKQAARAAGKGKP